MRGPHVIFFLSGIAGLGYEIVWTRMFAFGLGHEMPSLLAVVAAFFGGLAVGAWVLDGVVSRSRRPGRWYAGLEVLIGLWALASIVAIPALNRLAAEAIGVDPAPWRHGVLAFAIPFVGLLPATAAMGASFPAMERLAARVRGRGESVAGLYAVNTAGAMTGTLLTTFLLVPAIGFRATLISLAVINFACAIATVLGPATGEAAREPVEHRFEDQPDAVRLGLTVFCTGLLGIGYEVLGVRVIGQVLENTVYSFATALSMYLLGTAVGAALYQRLAGKRAFGATLAWLIQGMTLACLIGVAILPASASIYETTRGALGGGMWGSISAELLLAALVFLPPTILMGATFGHLAQAARRARGGVGRALAINTFGSALAPVVFGVLLLPRLGAKWSLLIVALGYLPLVPIRAIRPHRLVPSLASVLVLVALPSSLTLVEAPAGARILAYREGVMAAVAVAESGDGDRVLKVNNRFMMGGTVNSFADRRQAHIPLLLHAAPRRALFLGLGTGITAGAGTVHPGLDVTAVELLPEVVELLPYFDPANRLDRLGPGVRVADARRYVQASGDTYDVIVADLFHPARDGAGMLYTREHFATVATRLAPGGLFCQWLPLYQLDLDEVRVIVRTFLDVFPNTSAWLAHFNVATPMLGLVAGETPASHPGRWPEDWYAARVEGNAELATALTGVALGNELTLFGTWLADAATLDRFAGDGPINTDDRAIVMFRAPRFTYRTQGHGHGRLSALLDARNTSAIGEEPAAIVTFADRIDAYVAARDIYLRGMIALNSGQTAVGLETLLESVQRSPDFHTAYVTCLQEALDRVHRDPTAARKLLRALKTARPEDARAAGYLRRLFGE